MQQEMLNANRGNLVKRKISEAFYEQPTLKPQVFARTINHSHTSSLPVEAPLTTVQNPNLSNSINNLSETFIQPSIATVGTVAASPSRSSLHQSKENLHHVSANPLRKFPTHLNQFQHVKTHSLPASMCAENVDYANKYKSTAPPNRNMNINGDVPLPPGWSFEKTSAGQIYFINHANQTTTWEDPRKLYNLPTNQNEISSNLRAVITSSIPMPRGWEENVTANGEVYYINHVTRTTHWEDPRINIYMQQENAKLAYQNSYSSSTSSSSQSLNSGYNQTTAYKSYEYNSSMKQQEATSNKDVIRNLKQNLDRVLMQKNSIHVQLEDLSRQEESLKSKLSAQDLNEIMQILQKKDHKMNNFEGGLKAGNFPADTVENSIGVDSLDSTLVN